MIIPNLRRGLVRLWVVGSTLYVVAVFLVLGPLVTHEFSLSAKMRAVEQSIPESADRWWQDSPVVVAVSPWRTLTIVGSVAAVPPLVTLAIGASLLWAVKGFRE